jgi:hypothetical protein
VNDFKLTPILFEVLKESSFTLIRQSHLKVKYSHATDFELACSVASHLLANEKFGEVLLGQLDVWLLPLLLNDLDECRTAAQHITSYIVPHEIFSNLIAVMASSHSCFFGPLHF